MVGSLDRISWRATGLPGAGARTVRRRRPRPRRARRSAAVTLRPGCCRTLAVAVVRMPRLIGASVGVKETVTGAPSALESPCSISGVCRCPAADPVGAHRAHDLGADQVDLGGLAGPGGAGGGDDHDVVALQQLVAEAGSEGQQGRGRVAAGDGDPGGAAEGIALAGQFREAVGPGSGVRPSRRTSPRPAGSSSRWSAPASMTRVPAGSCAAISADAPCGSARNTTSCPARLSTVVSSRIRSARPWRCGCNSPSLEPALLWAVMAPMVTSG